MITPRLWMALAAGLLTVAPVSARELSEGVTMSGTTLFLANQARRNEAHGNYSSAILIYDELLKREPYNNFFAKHLIQCENALEKAQGEGSGPQLAQRSSKSTDYSEPPLPEAPEISSGKLTDTQQP